MTGSEWVTVFSFVAVIYGVSLWNDVAAALLAGAALLVAFVNSGITQKIVPTLGSAGGNRK